MRKRMGGDDGPMKGAAESGWGKARQDIDWVKERKGPF